MSIESRLFIARKQNLPFLAGSSAAAAIGRRSGDNRRVLANDRQLIELINRGSYRRFARIFGSTIRRANATRKPFGRRRLSPRVCTRQLAAYQWRERALAPVSAPAPASAYARRQHAQQDARVRARTYAALEGALSATTTTTTATGTVARRIHAHDSATLEAAQCETLRLSLIAFSCRRPHRRPHRLRRRRARQPRRAATTATTTIKGGCRGGDPTAAVAR